MRVSRVVLSLLLILSSSPHLSSRQSVTAPQGDPQALAILQQSFIAMGGQNIASVHDASVDMVASAPEDPAAGKTMVGAKMIGTQMWRTDSAGKDGAAALVVNGATRSPPPAPTRTHFRQSQWPRLGTG